MQEIFMSVRKKGRRKITVNDKGYIKKAGLSLHKDQ